jgi:hypothetical protein
MSRAQGKRPAGIPGAVCLLSALLLLTNPVQHPASAQSVADDRLRPALLGLQQEFAATLHEVTPALLKYANRHALPFDRIVRLMAAAPPQ